MAFISHSQDYVISYHKLEVVIHSYCECPLTPLIAEQKFTVHR